MISQFDEIFCSFPIEWNWQSHSMLLVFFTHPKVCTCEVLTVHVCRVENRIIWLSTSSFSKNWDIILPLFLRQKVFILVHGLEIEYPYLLFDPLPHFVGLVFCFAINSKKYFSVCPKNWQVRKNVWVVPSVKYSANENTWWFQPELWNYYLITYHTNSILHHCYQNQTSCRETQ